MKIFKTMFVVTTLIQFYLLFRLVAWGELIVKNYLVALYTQEACNKSVILDNRLPFLYSKLNQLGIPVDEFYSKDDTKHAMDLCDKADIQWSKYEAAHKRYHNYHWLPLKEKGE